MIIHDALAYIGVFTDNAFPHVGGFWSTPVGISITALLTLRHFFWMRHTTSVRALWHGVTATVWFAAFCGGLAPSFDPHHIVQTVLALLAVETLIDVYHWHKGVYNGIPKVS